MSFSTADAALLTVNRLIDLLVEKGELTTADKKTILEGVNQQLLAEQRGTASNSDQSA